MPKKLTYDFIKIEFEKEGYTLLSTEYKNANTKLDYICPNGHHHSTSWLNFQQKHFCPFCYGNTKLTYEYVKQEFEKAGYTLLSKEYINNRQKLEYTCDKGHIHKISWKDFLHGYGCLTCYTERRVGESNPLWKGGVTQTNLPLYETYASQLEKYQEVYKVEKDNLELLGINCTYCNKIFIPKASEVKSRIGAIKGNYKGEHHLYCSNECKEACPIFGQQTYPKNYKPYENTRPLQSQWAIMVKERDNYICQKCGTNEGDMIAHHIDPVINNPIESADIDNGITLCENCHKEAHLQIGCTLHELRC